MLAVGVAILTKTMLQGRRLRLEKQGHLPQDKLMTERV